MFARSWNWPFFCCFGWPFTPVLTNLMMLLKDMFDILSWKYGKWKLNVCQKLNPGLLFCAIGIGTGGGGTRGMCSPKFLSMPHLLYMSCATKIESYAPPPSPLRKSFLCMPLSHDNQTTTRPRNLQSLTVTLVNSRGRREQWSSFVREDKGDVGAATVREGRLCHVLWRGEEKRVLMKTLPRSSMICDRAPCSDWMDSCVLLAMCDAMQLQREVM